MSEQTTGTLADHPPLEWREGSAVTVVVAAAAGVFACAAMSSAAR